MVSGMAHPPSHAFISPGNYVFPPIAIDFSMADTVVTLPATDP